MRPDERDELVERWYREGYSHFSRFLMLMALDWSVWAALVVMALSIWAMFKKE